MNPTEKGVRTEGIILSALLKKGYRVLLPFGGGSRYDLVYEEDGKFIRVQCKTATYANGCVVFNSRSVSRDGQNLHYAGDCDVFGVYCPDLDSTYLVPVELVAKGKGSLRVEEPRVTRTLQALWAKDFELT
jgi:hypothetical protein